MFEWDWQCCNENFRLSFQFAFWYWKVTFSVKVKFLNCLNHLFAKYIFLKINILFYCKIIQKIQIIIWRVAVLTVRKRVNHLVIIINTPAHLEFVHLAHFEGKSHAFGTLNSSSAVSCALDTIRSHLIQCIESSIHVFLGS